MVRWSGTTGPPLGRRPWSRRAGPSRTLDRLHGGRPDDVEDRGAGAVHRRDAGGRGLPGPAVGAGVDRRRDRCGERVHGTRDGADTGVCGSRGAAPSDAGTTRCETLHGRTLCDPPAHRLVSVRRSEYGSGLIARSVRGGECPLSGPTETRISGMSGSRAQRNSPSVVKSVLNQDAFARRGFSRSEGCRCRAGVPSLAPLTLTAVRGAGALGLSIHTRRRSSCLEVDAQSGIRVSTSNRGGGNQHEHDSSS